MRQFFLITAGLFWSTRARAHAFDTGSDHYAQFIEGAGVVLSSPETLLTCLALGILVSLWDLEGMVRVWPAFLFGQIAGIPLASFVGIWVVPVLQSAGLVVAVLAALMPRHFRAEAIAASVVIGALVLAASLEGHGFLELPGPIHVGILFGANLVVASGAGITRVALERVEAAWMRIVWRIAASWLGAILVLLLAFTVTSN